MTRSVKDVEATMSGPLIHRDPHIENFYKPLCGAKGEKGQVWYFRVVAERIAKYLHGHLCRKCWGGDE